MRRGVVLVFWLHSDVTRYSNIAYYILTTSGLILTVARLLIVDAYYVNYMQMTYRRSRLGLVASNSSLMWRVPMRALTAIQGLTTAILTCHSFNVIISCSHFSFSRP